MAILAPSQYVYYMNQKKNQIVTHQNSLTKLITPLFHYILTTGNTLQSAERDVNVYKSWHILGTSARLSQTPLSQLGAQVYFLLSINFS